jgi:hypothetical protein
MKHIRIFETAELAAAILPALEYSTLSKIRGEHGVSLNLKVVPPTPTVDPTIPFYIEDVSGSANTIYIKKGLNNAPTLTIEKSTNGTTWETMGTTSTAEITATVPANGRLYLRCNATQWAYGDSQCNYFNSASGNFNVGGNINSLLYGDSFEGQTEFPSGVGIYTFARLFYRNAHVISAEQLLLPATTLTEFCYSGMFFNCTSLTTAPVLPATTLVERCYYSMFNSCTSLTTAPELPATTLAKLCYYGMFQNCSNLNYIKCLATDISASDCTKSWVEYIAVSGTFIKDSNMSSWTTGNSGIPSGWTVEDAA